MGYLTQNKELLLILFWSFSETDIAYEKDEEVNLNTIMEKLELNFQLDKSSPNYFYEKQKLI